MKRLKYYLLSLLTFALAACGEKDAPEIKISELSFTTTVHTRALPNVLTELKDGSQMSIFTRSSDYAGLASMTKAVNNAGMWKADPTIVLEDGITVTLQAVYPYSDNNTSASSIPVDVNSQIDYLYSGSNVTVSKENPTANLTMKHAMSVLAFNIDKNGYTGAGKLQEIKLSGSGLYTMGRMNATTGAITGSSNGEFSKSYNTTLQAGGFTNDIPAMFVIPFTSTGDNLQITIKVDDKEYSSFLPQQTISGGNKYLFRMALTERELVIFPDVSEVISLNVTTDQMPVRNLSTLTIQHSNVRMNVPTINGSEGFFGKVYWGDGESQDYATGINHTYKSENSYTIVIESWETEDVVMSNLSGVTEIDLSKF